MTSSVLSEHLEDFARLGDELAAIEAKYGQDRGAWPAGQQSRAENLERGLSRLDDDIRRLQDRAEKVEAVRAAAGLGGGNVETVGGVSTGWDTRRTDPWQLEGDSVSRHESTEGLRARALDAIEAVAGVPTENRQKVANLLGARDDTDEYLVAQSRATAEYVLASSAPAYRSAFLKVLRNPTHGFLNWTAAEREAYSRTESVRSAMSLTNANGGYLVPFTLDPTIVLTNTGALNPWRELSSVRQTTTNAWNGVTSAGVNAAWLAEAAEATDNTPTFGNIQIATEKAAAWVYGSYEVLADSDFAAQLPALLGDAKDRLEEAAFATGTGSGQPKGVITAAVAASKTVNSTGAAAFAAADVYKPFDALPDRWYGNASAVVNKSIGLKIRQFDTAGGSAFWANLGGDTPDRLLGRPYREATSVASTVATGNKIMVVGDFGQFYIVDRLGTTMVYEPLVKGANQRPTGQAGWFAYWRVGSDVAVADAFRVLNIG